MRKGYFILGAAAVVTMAVIVVCFYIGSGKTDDIAEHNPEMKYSSSAAITKTSAASTSTTEYMFAWSAGLLPVEDMPQLQVEEVLVQAQQQIQEGTPLVQFTADSVKRVRSVLQRELRDAYIAYSSLKERQKEQRLQVSQTYDNYIADGKYASAVCNDKCGVLQEKEAAAKEAVDQKQNEVNLILSELAQLQQELVSAQRYLKEAQTAVSENYNDRYKNAYYYAVYENTREEAQRMVDQLEEQIGLLTERNESLLYEVDDAVRAYHQTVMELEKEKLAAKMNCDTEIYYSEMASEWRDIQVVQLDNALQEARAHYESALQKIRDFDDRIVRSRLLSVHEGVITDIRVKQGDYVHPNDALVTLTVPTQSQP